MDSEKLINSAGSETNHIPTDGEEARIPDQEGNAKKTNDVVSQPAEAVKESSSKQLLFAQPSLPSNPGCFSGNTLVLMDNGLLKPINKIRPGQTVQSLKDSRKVLALCCFPKGDQTMYKINHLDFSFTGKHLFVNYKYIYEEDKPQYHLAMSPLEALKSLPTLSYDGIGQLSNQSQLYGYDYHEMDTRPVNVDSIDEVDGISDDEAVYDLILEPDDSGKYEYIAGTEEFLFVVASKLPPFNNAKHSELLAMDIIIYMITAASPKLNELYEKFGYKVFQEKLVKAIENIPQSITAFHYQYGDIPEDSFFYLNDKLNFAGNMAKIMSVFKLDDGSYNVPAGVAFDYLMQFLFCQLSSYVDIGYRVIPYEQPKIVFALTLFDLYLLGDVPSDILLNVLTNVSITIKVGQTVALQESLNEDFRMKHQSDVQDQVDVKNLYGVRLNKQWYTPIALENENKKMSIQFSDEQKRKFKILNISNIPFTKAVSRCIPLTMNGEVIGSYNIEMRCLSKLELERERSGRTPKSAEAYELRAIANGICHDAVEVFTELINSIC